MDDREIAAAIVAGDPAGLASAYDTYAAPLYGYCRWMLHDPADAAGALQHTFVIAVTRLRGLRDPRKLRPWLYAVARRECRRRLGTAGLSAAAGAAGQPADGGRGAGQAELRALIRAAVDGLEPADREVIELSLAHHLDDSDLAVVLGLPRSRARARAARARGQLGQALGMLLIARAGRTACPALGELLAGWDGRLTSQTRGLVSWHTGQCQDCAGRRRGALRPQALSGLLPLAALPPGLREQVLRLCAGLPRDALRYRQRRTRRAESPRPARVPRAATHARRGRLRGNPGAAAAVVMWAAAAVSVTVITFTSSHPAAVAAARTSGGAPAAASTPANISRGTPANTGAPGARSSWWWCGRPHYRATASPGRRLAPHCPGYGRGLPGARAEGTKMAAEQGRGTRTGRVPGLNVERIYTTTIPAEELAQALADHFRAQGFEAQVFRTSGDRTAMQARKESLWRHLLGVAYALTVIFTPGEGQLSIGLGGHEWVDAAVSGVIGLVAVPPVLLGTAYGIWKENQLDKDVWQVIDERVSAPAEAGP